VDLEEIIALSAIIGAVAAILPLALTHGLHQAQEASEAWRKLAERHGLTFNSGRHVVSKTSVTGALGGREFQLERVGDNKNTQSAYMQVTLKGQLPAGLHMQTGKPKAGASSVSAETPLAAGEREVAEVRVGESHKITASDPADLPGYLTASRRKAVLQLSELGGELEGQTLRVRVAKEAADLEALDTALRALAEMAPVLDTT
jgi:hypothetical protein